jgi:hypothetical protein
MFSIVKPVFGLNLTALKGYFEHID